MNKKKDLLKNTLVIMLGRLSNQLITLLLLPIYTTYLTPGEYGLIDLALTYFALLIPLVTFQLEAAAFRFLIDARGDDKRINTIVSSTVRAVIAIVFLLAIIYVPISEYFGFKYSALIGFVIITTIFSNLFLQFARGYGKIKVFTTASIISAAVTLVTTIVTVVTLHMGVKGVLVSLGFSNVVCGSYLFYTLKLRQSIKFRGLDKPLLKQLLGYSLPLVPGGASWWVISVSDRTVITLALGLQVNGIYAVANKYVGVLSSLFFITNLAIMESVSLHIKSKGAVEFISKVYSKTVVMFGGLGLLLIACAPLIFSIVIGDAFKDALHYVPILLVGSLLSVVSGIYMAIYVAKKMVRQVAATSIWAAVINIILTISFIKVLGAYAAALATVVAFASMATFRHYDLKKYIHLTYEKHLFLKIGAAYTVVIGLYYIKSPVANIINIALAAAIAILLNRSTIGSAKNMFFGMLKAKGGKAS